MPVENTVSEKNSMMHTTDSDTNAVFTLLAIWRTVNRFSFRRYTPRSRVSTAMAVSYTHLRSGVGAGAH